MTTYGRHALIAMVLAWHAATSLCGPGHHALDGLPGCMGASHAGTPDDHAAGILLDDPSCPICHALRHVPLPVPRAWAGPTTAVEPAPPAPAPAPTFREAPRSASPRAPPSLLV